MDSLVRSSSFEDTLLEFCKVYPRDYTYLGIGSCPHSVELPDSLDQIYPVFVREMSEFKTIRCILLDPSFTEKVADAYVVRRGLSKSPFLSGWRYTSPHLELVFLPEEFHHDRIEFLRGLVLCILQKELQLVVQNFSGYSVESQFLSLYTEFKDKYSYKDLILMDVSYGLDTGCLTDMSKYKPFYTMEGCFINLLLLHPSQLSRYLGADAELDSRILTILKKKFWTILNDYHVEYRRMKQGIPCFYLKHETAEDIMKDMQTNLFMLVPGLLKGKILTEEKHTELQHLFRSYKDHDMYAWQSKVNNIVR